MIMYYKFHSYYDLIYMFNILQEWAAGSQICIKILRSTSEYFVLADTAIIWSSAFNNTKLMSCENIKCD